MDLFRRADLNSLVSNLVPNYNPDRYDAAAMRIFLQGHDPVVTVYAVDTLKQEQHNYPAEKLPVKKFKIKLPFVDFIRLFKRFDATLTNDAYDIGDMLVTNK
jgi:hypothetical protein